ncbi:MAG: hypothetical protein QW478_00435 [Candidatus Micrarchaeaceae archaeon]
MIQLWVTTYEYYNNTWNPTLSHVFYGHTLNDAIDVAKSHLITDFFFSSSFVESMNWRESTLILLNKYRMLGIKQMSQLEYQNIVKDLHQYGVRVNTLQKEQHMDKIIDKVDELNSQSFL